MTGDQLSIDDALTELGRVIPSRTSDPSTSHGAEPVKVKAGTQRAHLLYSFNDYDRNPDGYGLTDEQAMALTLAVSPFSEFAKRCSELREGGFIEPTGETRAGSAGPQRIVSRITERGRSWIRENRP